VLTVSALSDPPSPRREVLCPLGLETGFETLAFASEVARCCGSVLSIMHVVEDPVGPAPAEWVGRWARERLSEAVEAAGAGVRAKALLGVGSPYQEILRVARERRVGLIVMGIHDTHQPCRGFFGSTAAHIVREAQCAVITVPSEVGRRSVAVRTSSTTGMAAGGFIP
jgi:nucleotide-binding universal stress UspA family protein